MIAYVLTICYQFGNCWDPPCAHNNWQPTSIFVPSACDSHEWVRSVSWVPRPLHKTLLLVVSCPAAQTKARGGAIQHGCGGNRQHLRAARQPRSLGGGVGAWVCSALEAPDQCGHPEAG